MNLPEFNSKMEKIILSSIEKNLKASYGSLEYENLDILYGSLHSLKRDISLSFIFPNYLSGSDKEKYRYIRMLENFKEISSSTYENQPVNIGIICCPNAKALNQLKNLDLEFISFPVKKNLVNFFQEEKPWLRLIDNQSLAVVINNKSKVIGILRKQNNGKSINSIIENLFNNFSHDNLQIHIPEFFENYFSKIKDDILELSQNSEGENYLDTLEVLNIMTDIMAQLFEEVIEKKTSSQIPEFIYISSNNNEIDFFTSRPFVISFERANWKLKHYDLLNSFITTTTMTLLLKKIFTTDFDDPEKEMKSFFEKNNKFLSSIRRISKTKTSAIFLILFQKEKWQENHNNLLEQESQNNTIEKQFTNVIKKDISPMNISEIDFYLFERIASIDGAVVIDSNFDILNVGEIIKLPEKVDYVDTYGTGTRAARYASKYGIAIKISEDGEIYAFHNEKLLIKI